MIITCSSSPRLRRSHVKNYDDVDGEDENCFILYQTFSISLSRHRSLFILQLDSVCEKILKVNCTGDKVSRGDFMSTAA
jgi:hypothetical protein